MPTLAKKLIGVYLFTEDKPPEWIPKTEGSRVEPCFALQQRNAKLLDKNGVWWFLHRMVKTTNRGQQSWDYVWKSVDPDMGHTIPKLYLMQALILGE